MRIRRAASCLGLLLLGVCSFIETPAFGQQEPPIRARKGGIPKKGAGRVALPGSRLDALERMTPEQQERFLSSLPSARRLLVREMLSKWRNMSPEERALARQSLGEFSGLPPERQRRIRILYGEFNSLPAERQLLLREELKGLRGRDPLARIARMRSREFIGKYSLEERRLLRELSKTVPRLDAAEPESEEQQQQDR